MKKIFNWIYKFNDGIIILTSIISVSTIFWLILKLLVFFEFDLTIIKKLGFFGIYTLILHGLIIGILNIMYKNYLSSLNETPLDPIKSNESDSLLVNDLITSLSQAMKNKKFEEVIRIGTSLDRPLFLSGNYKARLEIGLLVEDASASIDNKMIQMKTLIDSIGWTYAELGEYKNGEKNIKHGLRISKNLNSHFYTAKALRHLGAISRRSKEYAKAKESFTESLAFAHKITNSEKKKESIAGVAYALASLHFYLEEYDKSIAYINNSIKYFSEIKDITRLTKSLTKKANICYANNDKEIAKDLFRSSLKIAQESGLRLVAVRSMIGLCKIYLEEEKWDKARKYVEMAQNLEKEIHSVSEMKEIKMLIEKIPQ